MKDWNLVCTGCGAVLPVADARPRCAVCGEPLEVEGVSRGTVREGNRFGQTIFDRYADFLPFSPDDPPAGMREGFTPLVGSEKIAGELPVGSLDLKDESRNPTWSFKDRGTASAVRHALALGFKRIGTLSSGNMAASVAAYGARAGLPAIILVSASIPVEKLNPIAVYHPVLLRVEGDYGDLYFRSLEIGSREGIYFMNSDVPFRVEGSKTIAYEICEQLGFNAPDFVVVPTSSGGNLRGIIKGFEDFYRCGLIGRLPRFICAQAKGCSPIFNAFTSGEERVRPLEKTDTIAHAIENPFPPSGNEVLRQLRERNGIALAVTDDEILSAQGRLAGAGVFCQPAAAVPLAAVRRLCADGVIGKNDHVVCIVTGGGLKYTAVLDRLGFDVRTCRAGELEELLGE
ncbi:MAG: threonine synthase [Deltaproteobacteria bacterium]|nr:threonine synthase [Deltaproteobacteria bacterium]